MTLEVDVQRASVIDDTPPDSQFHRWASAAVIKPGNYEMSVRIVDESESESLNDQYRNKQGPTNVLAFTGDVELDAGKRLLGDIVVCAPIVVAEARSQQKEPEAHWAHLVVHGTLHLQGFNHENDADAREMEGVEVDILARLGYSNPYNAEFLAETMRGNYPPS